VISASVFASQGRLGEHYRRVPKAARDRSVS
jgi:hypothetical protein